MTTSPGSPFPCKGACDVIQQSFSVPFEYPVLFTRGAFDPANPLLEAVIDRRGGIHPHRVIAYVDSGCAETRPHLIPDLAASFSTRANKLHLVEPINIVGGGEQAKNGWDRIKYIMESLGERRMCRQSTVLAVGGGSVLDMVGFAASLVHRGLRLLRMPSTVLAQNDAGIGVKNGMDEHGSKNFVGTFAPPFAVINDLDLLSSLKDRDWVGGISEAFKVAIIKDADFFDFLCASATRLRNREEEPMEKLVRKCAAIHLAHISSGGDPFEMGSARPLDFGHWSAHKLEVMSRFALGHGQAVAIGIALDSFYAQRKGFISEADLDRILRGLSESGLPVWSELLESRTSAGRLEILDGLEQFREHLGGRLTVTLPHPIGHKEEIHSMDPDIIRDGIAFLRTAATRLPQPVSN